MRRLACALLAVAVLLPLAPTPAAATLADRAITWTVDHKHKTITVKAKLQLYLKACMATSFARGPAGIVVTTTGRDCTATAADIAKAIRDNIDAVWNRGYHYRCYRLIFKVDITVTTNRFTVDPNRIGVGIDRMTAGVRSHVDPTIASKQGIILDKWDSNDPADRVEPDNGFVVPTEWGYPAGNTNTYAHEFGHLLGLHDTYVEGVWVPKAGAPDDIMSTMRNFVDQSTIDRVVERNRDRLKDTKGNPVDLDELTCELVFRAFLSADELSYRASHLMNSGATPPCRGGAVTASQDQRLIVDSTGVDVEVIDDPAAPAGYRLTALVDQLALQLQTVGRARDLRAAGYFDLPITVEVRRLNWQPASGAVPPVLDLATPGCADGGQGGAIRSDCGRRDYETWLAIHPGPGTTVWPEKSLLPRVLSGAGYSPLRLDSLYRSCSGPTPWPGTLRNEPGSNIAYGALPTRDALQKTWDDWARDGKPGQLEIDGNGSRDRIVPGSLVKDSYAWTLTLCPVDKDGNIPTGCS